MQPANLARAFTFYGLAPLRIATAQKGYRNTSHAANLPTGQIVNFILYKSEPGIVTTIKNANAVGDFLASRGFPARSTADPRILCVQSSSRTKYGSLYNYLPGETIPWEAYTQAHIKLLGHTMGQMHTLLATFDTPLPNAALQNLALNKRMQKYFAESGVRTALAKKLNLKILHDNFLSLHIFCAGLPNQQALHLDFVRGNVLFNAERITGVIDFEKTARGHRLLDVARTLAFLLVDCKFKPEEKIRKYFLHSGYKKRGGQQLVTSPEFLEKLVDFYLLHDFYKFLRHNPYESLPSNEHFARTKTLLLKRGILG